MLTERERHPAEERALEVIAATGFVANARDGHLRAGDPAQLEFRVGVRSVEPAVRVDYVRLYLVTPAGVPEEVAREEWRRLSAALDASGLFEAHALSVKRSHGPGELEWEAWVRILDPELREGRPRAG